MAPARSEVRARSRTEAMPKISRNYGASKLPSPAPLDNPTTGTSAPSWLACKCNDSVKQVNVPARAKFAMAFLALYRVFSECNSNI